MLRMVQTQAASQPPRLHNRKLPDFRLAFQPIIDFSQQNVFGYEALVRGRQGQNAEKTLANLHPDLLHTFDKAVCYRAMTTAKRHCLQSRLCINCSADAISDQDKGLSALLSAASRLGFPANQLMFELVEIDHASDHQKIKQVFSEYRQHGLVTAIDDFGSGYADINLLADWQPDFVKLDIQLIRNIHLDTRRQMIVRSLIQILKDLQIRSIAVGVETTEEWAFLRSVGIDLVQGFMFAKPALGRLESVRETIWLQ